MGRLPGLLLALGPWVLVAGVVIRGPTISLVSESLVAAGAVGANGSFLGDLEVPGEFHFLGAQVPRVTYYDGSLELLHYPPDGLCPRVVLVEEMTACPRRNAVAFTLCRSTRRAQSPAYAGLTLDPTRQPLLRARGPADAVVGFYVLRVWVDGAANASLFPLSLARFPAGDLAPTAPGDERGAVELCDPDVTPWAPRLRLTDVFAPATPPPAARTSAAPETTPPSGAAAETPEAEAAAEGTPASPTPVETESEAGAPRSSGGASVAPTSEASRYELTTLRIVQIAIPACIIACVALGSCACCLARRCRRRQYRPSRIYTPPPSTASSISAVNEAALARLGDELKRAPESPRRSKRRPSQTMVPSLAAISEEAEAPALVALERSPRRPGSTERR
ncbi:envelope glycoprotein I [Macacine alphaherpesvirus 1]|uniref:Envelope glycoprotein I n=1 Tax=Macacine alphaherpesvirus 2 TaxID=2845554 RepID=A0A1X9WG16_9ALPH|nr:envelope glycoprotein I [Macacine alphaherpesvirus 1]ARS01703.1 envelope glycoprotein I [Macacine alphaherpesvirus 2]